MVLRPDFNQVLLKARYTLQYFSKCCTNFELDGMNAGKFKIDDTIQIRERVKVKHRINLVLGFTTPAALLFVLFFSDFLFVHLAS